MVEALYLTINRCEDSRDTVPYFRAIAPAIHADSLRQRVLGLSAAVQLHLISGKVERAHRLIADLLDAGEAMCHGIGSIEMRSKIFLDLGGIEHIALALGRHDHPRAAFRLFDAVAARVHHDSVATA
ncbi:MAG: hypothetical protein R2710_25630 [Acidimicrobiales bacterium]